MPIILNKRDTSTTERMDDPDCDLVELENTYRQFGTVNSLISGWHTIYKHKIRPHLELNNSYNLLDLGFGGGDIPIKLSQWAEDDGFSLRVTAIDPDPRAINFVKKLGSRPNIEFLQCGIFDLDPSKEKYDFVISNHLLHHLDEQRLPVILTAARNLSRQSVIFNDIRRSDVGYLFFNLLARPIFRSSFITEDGLTSIKRSYTRQELAQSVPKEWIVKSLFPFRLLLMYHHD
ncbi:MAG: methyltransferase domain-containing protein [Balneolaceae bacterium]|jgi:2-polyprenyl-3-methyl-5-hydroxy-6-metoxy-1,4-benzoquinol methylase